MDLAPVLVTLRRGWWLLALTGLLGGGAGFARDLNRPADYRATVQLFATVPDSTAGPSGTTRPGPDRLRSYARIASSSQVLQPVIDQLQLPTSVGGLAERVRADAAPDTVLIEVSVTDTHAARAAATANAIGTRLADVVRGIETPAGGGVSPVKLSVTEPATAPSAPVAARPGPGLGLGLVAGLGVGVLGSALSGRRRRRVSRSTPAATQAHRPSAAARAPRSGAPSTRRSPAAPAGQAAPAPAPKAGTRAAGEQRTSQVVAGPNTFDLALLGPAAVAAVERRRGGRRTAPEARPALQGRRVAAPVAVPVVTAQVVTAPPAAAPPAAAPPAAAPPAAAPPAAAPPAAAAPAVVAAAVAPVTPPAAAGPQCPPVPPTIELTDLVPTARTRAQGTATATTRASRAARTAVASPGPGPSAWDDLLRPVLDPRHRPVLDQVLHLPGDTGPAVPVEDAAPAEAAGVRPDARRRVGARRSDPDAPTEPGPVPTRTERPSGRHR